MNRIIKFAIMALVLSSSASWANHDHIQVTLDNLQNALNQHDFAILSPYLADEFSYSGYGGSMGLNIMTQIVDQYPRTIKSIAIQAVEKSGHQINVTAKIDLGDEIEIKEIVLTNEFKILMAPIVEIQMAGHGGAKKSPQDVPSSPDSNFPASMEVEFELVDRLIMVTAEVEGVRGNFMVDSGATGFILNAKYLPHLANDSKPTPKVAHGVNGEIQGTRMTTASGFKWQEIELDSIEAMYYDLSHLEEAIGADMLGIIGAEFLNQFTLQFEYDRRVLTLYSVDPASLWASAPSQTIDFETIAHMPTFTARIGNYSLLLGIDSGAEGNMIFKKWETRLQEHYEVVGEEGLNGADQSFSMATVVVMDQFDVEGISYMNQDFLLADLVFDHEVMIDGLVGYDFLSSYKTAIDFGRQKLHIWSAN